MTDAGYAPDPWQADLLRSAAHRVLLLTARQAGKSTATGFLALRESLLTPNNTVLVVCPSQRQSAELVRRVVDATNRLGRPMPLVAESVTRLEFANGSRIIALPSTEGSIRGFTAGMVILDEAARRARAGNRRRSPHDGGQRRELVALSTAFARSGFFYEQWSGSEPWVRVRVDGVRDVPASRPEFLAEERRVLGERWFAMEYECQFGDDVAAVFTRPTSAPRCATTPSPRSSEAAHDATGHVQTRDANPRTQSPILLRA